ncbi:unnamed protein product [Lactuca saligna]|uniref:Uncharacterized protein n=1 Tax=Lactuca saligna TaxID=75948 RepID=A0AA35VXF6_LACSI|nr:unnamed protein product [Lactuca saligna]
MTGGKSPCSKSIFVDNRSSAHTTINILFELIAAQSLLSLASIGYLALAAIGTRCNPAIGSVALPAVGIRSLAPMGYVAPTAIDVQSVVSIGCLDAAAIDVRSVVSIWLSGCCSHCGSVCCVHWFSDSCCHWFLVACVCSSSVAFVPLPKAPVRFLVLLWFFGTISLHVLAL